MHTEIVIDEMLNLYDRIETKISSLQLLLNENDSIGKQKLKKKNTTPNYDKRTLVYVRTKRTLNQGRHTRTLL
jgi:hypothetical protein